MEIPTDELTLAASEFDNMANDMQLVIEHLEKVIFRLEENWHDANNQTFFQYYDEWRRNAGSFCTLLSSTATELKAIAENYESASS